MKNKRDCLKIRYPPSKLMGYFAKFFASRPAISNSKIGRRSRAAGHYTQFENKKGFEASFGWLFALIVGAFILFLAIFLAGRISENSQYEIDTTTAKEIGFLLNPIETGVESGVGTFMNLPQETRIYNNCVDDEPFGRQRIQLSQKSLGKWSTPGAEVGFNNKYIFSADVEEGKRFEIASQSFELPFKVANLIYLIPSNKEYCFVGAPERIENQVKGFGRVNLVAGNCSLGSEKEVLRVCFSGGSNNNCDVQVSYDDGEGFVSKTGGSGRLYFIQDSLMFGAIFAEQDLYECQVNRLMLRAANLANLYLDKSKFISSKECTSGLERELIQLKNSASTFKTNKNFALIKQIADDLEEKHFDAVCKLW